MSNDEEMDQIRRRFGKPTLGAAVYMALVSLATNAYLLHLVVNGEASRVGIALYGVLELIAYSVIGNITMAAVPKDLRVGSPDVPLPKRILAIVGMSAILCSVAWFAVHADTEHLDMLRNARDPFAALADLNILTPLALTITLAGCASFSDWFRWRGSGQPFVSGLALSAAAKFVTAIAAPIAAMLASDDIHHDAARATLVWCSVYLGIKCGLELFFLYWQYRGMPGKAAASRAQ